MANDNTKLNFEAVMGYLANGSRKPKNPLVKKNTPMKLKDACFEAGISKESFYYYINAYPEFEVRYKELRDRKREIIKTFAEENLEKVLGGEDDGINELDRAKLSLDLLKSTSKDFNKGVEAENGLKINFNISSEEILRKIDELSKGI